MQIERRYRVWHEDGTTAVKTLTPAEAAEYPRAVEVKTAAREFPELSR